ncbi:signal recognition particle-docking protein FtsY [Alkalilimnicola sp. S0819]|uniref:signal recognition particle-docking protein FtsY n=1 Tax=Alkalilimnicola sp. S0819 TaxID=2613922 RepID=UPI001261A6F9|nr:signal recognition particle-docking protein FtsY [Alkalilimnicola sp. S0819]KAB7627364.1 signal recognition particle-docking protein FtsY [Alkalilimnicola sp. S0819]MPQ16082.1 signal recognition particle-docking protein FtsY [Alkalilimnicola sp. S0819]
MWGFRKKDKTGSKKPVEPQTPAAAEALDESSASPAPESAPERPSAVPAPAAPAEAGERAAPDTQDESAEPRRRPGLFARLKAGLSRTGSGLTEGLSSLFLGKKVIDDELLEELETRLLMADVGVEATQRIIDGVTERLKRKELNDVEALLAGLQADMRAILAPCARPLVLDERHQPFVILMVGVNGAGKTTTIGKLAKRFQGEGRAVMLAAGDTFRAAAVEQLQVWGERSGIPVVAQHTGADSASVCFDALQAARARQMDVLIADTAGRLHTQSNLMDELAKVKRVLGKQDATAPHETLLVLDASNGQNALAQARQFHQAVGVDGVVLTKLDGTAKGGVIFAIAEQLGLPVRFIGVGEGAEDLRPFDADEFVRALLGRD